MGKIIGILLLLLISTTLFSQKNDNRKNLEEYYSHLDSCTIVHSDENAFIIKYSGHDVYFTFIFDGDYYINLLIEVGKGKKKNCIEYLELVGYKENKRSRVWHLNDTVAYLLWDWSAKKWYISIYLNEHLKKI